MDFVNAIRSARDAQKAIRTGGPLPPPPPPSVNPSESPLHFLLLLLQWVLLVITIIYDGFSLISCRHITQLSVMDLLSQLHKRLFIFVIVVDLY